MGRKHPGKSASILVLAVAYAIATVAGILVFLFLVSRGLSREIPALLVADLAAMLVIWIHDIAFGNVSVYDPYWSVAPPVMFTAFALYKGVLTLPVVLLLIAIWYWGIRLTGNWAYTFKGLGHEDWRYTRYRERLSRLPFELTHFFGLVLMPTLLVFACMVPGFRLFGLQEGANLLTWTGFAMCIAAATIQLVSDTQSHRFRNGHPGQVCNVGLWKHGRHPNYFGEIMMWWGVWVMAASLRGIDWLILGPVAMTCLFLFVSIPMMERRQLKSKPGYAEYRKNTRILL